MIMSFVVEMHTAAWYWWAKAGKGFGVYVLQIPDCSSLRPGLPSYGATKALETFSTSNLKTIA